MAHAKVPKSRQCELHESVSIDLSQGSPVVLDEANLVLRNVLLCGRHSVNGGAKGRDYSDAALRGIAELSEGKGVFRNHHLDGNVTEQEFVGVTRNGHVEPEGTRGDWFFTEDMLPRLRSIVKAKMGVVGMSLHGGGRRIDRGPNLPELVESYTSHGSIDFVVRPATTKGLAESEGSGVSPGLSEGDSEASAVTREESTVESNDKLLEQIQGQLADVQARLATESEARKLAEAREAKLRETQKAIDATGRKVGERTRAALERCADRAEMDALLAETAPAASSQQAQGQANPPAGTKPTDPLADGKGLSEADLKKGAEDIIEAIKRPTQTNGMTVLYERRG